LPPLLQYLFIRTRRSFVSLATFGSPKTKMFFSSYSRIPACFPPPPLLVLGLFDHVPVSAGFFFIAPPPSRSVFFKAFLSNSDWLPSFIEGRPRPFTFLTACRQTSYSRAFNGCLPLRCLFLFRGHPHHCQTPGFPFLDEGALSYLSSCFPLFSRFQS